MSETQSDLEDFSPNINSYTKTLNIKVDCFSKGIWIVLAVVVIALAVVVCGLAIFTTRWLIESKYIDAVILIIGFSILLVAVLLYMIQCGMEVAKKALDLQIEQEKRKSEESRRAVEDKECETAAKEQREHELRLAQLTRTVKVEVSDV